MSVLKSNLLLLLAAAIWGFAFVAQRVGMEYVGPFTFNGVRFALGSLSLVPLMLFYNKNPQDEGSKDRSIKHVAGAGLLAGAVLFMGASLQQIGLVYTTAGKAAFITCLYIVLVPLVGVFLKQYVSMSTWLGSIIAVAGLYLLCVKDSFSISYGEFLELVGALFWAVHILVIDHFSRKVDVLKLSFFQFVTCSIMSLITAFFIETISINTLSQALMPILYGGICSVGIAYTLQVVGQKNAQPSHAAIILSMETVFATIGGWMILNEMLGRRELLGCIIMLVGMLLSQLQNIRQSKKQNESNLAYSCSKSQHELL
ncbi:DMT family transporter [Pelosinus sp. IPA-1]|uniref:DMT family transporter n=1 Tax=Pelosinus sp. IPA-1 TaxID=3029569 RepID=UPI0024361956|nr:DMT family transporter [Pelosinus sp. IPA-1]GMA99026.1 permease [Pelosinus sp. IPA-1]